MSVQHAFLSTYPSFVLSHKDAPFTPDQKRWQRLRRGQYAEFNLLFDEGTKVCGSVLPVSVTVPRLTVDVVAMLYLSLGAAAVVALMVTVLVAVVAVPAVIAAIAIFAIIAFNAVVAFVAIVAIIAVPAVIAIIATVVIIAFNAVVAVVAIVAIIAIIAIIAF